MSVFKVLSEILNATHGISTPLYFKFNTCKLLSYCHIMRRFYPETGCCRDYRQLHAQ